MLTKLDPAKSAVIIAVPEEDVKGPGEGSHLAKVTHLINGRGIGTRDLPCHQPPLVNHGTRLLPQGIRVPESKASTGIKSVLPSGPQCGDPGSGFGSWGVLSGVAKLTDIAVLPRGGAGLGHLGLFPGR